MIKLTSLGGGEESPQLFSVSQSVPCSLQHHSTVGHMWLLFNLNILNVKMRLSEIVIADLDHGDSRVPERRGARPVSDSLIPASSFTRLEMSVMSVSTAFRALVYWPWP